MPELNPEQKLAAEHGEGPLLVVAGPGAGKTRVIIERITHLLSPESNAIRGLRPENILALTFTDKAAGEMRSRIAKALPDLENPPLVSTFHAFCYKMLCKRQAEKLLLDKIDVWIFLRRHLGDLGLNFYQKLAEPGAFLHDLNDFFARCQDELIEPDDFEAYVNDRERAARPAADDVLEQERIARLRELSNVFRVSRKLIEESGATSLGSLVSETAAMWRADKAALEEARAQYRAVLVDEFQDTNYAQIELLKLLVPPPYCITAVGDDDQAIYRFRGASHGAFDMFSQAFPGHRAIYLSTNYRSTRKVLRTASAVIARNTRYAQKPALTSLHPEGFRVTLVKARSPQDESLWIADEIQRLERGGLSYGSMAVLYRAHSQRELLSRELDRRGMPRAIRGLSILSESVLRDLAAWLRVIDSPSDAVSLTRALLAPCWGISEPAAQRARDQAARERCSLYDAFSSLGTAEASTMEGWTRFQKLLKTFRRLARTSGVAALAAKLIHRLGWDGAASAREQRALDAFLKFLRAWEEKSETRRLAEFEEYFRYFVEAGGKVEAPEAPGNAVQMMTVHAAKGLEFPAVFILGVSPRRFPSTERQPVLEFPEALRKGPAPPSDIHLQEERRLFYVALTRAERRLYVSSVSKSERQQSIFVQDLLADPALRARDIEVIDAPEQAAPKESHPDVLTAGGDSRPAQANLFGESEFAPGGDGLHAHIAAWAASPAPAMEGAPRLSATSAEDYLACPLKYKFQHALKIPAAPQAALTFGSLMHQSVRRYFELRRERAPALPAFAEVEQFYLDRWKSIGFEDEHHEAIYRGAGLAQLRGFVEKHNTLPLDGAEIEMERGFEVDAGGITLEGRIDQIRRAAPDGAMGAGGPPPEVELIDYKTGRARSQRDADKSLQLSIYAFAAGKILGRPPSKLTFYNLTANDAVSSVRTPGDIEDALDKVRAAADGIARGEFSAAPGFLCRWCNYVPLCPAHEGV